VTGELELRFARLVEHHVLHDALPSIEAIAADRPDLIAPLRALAFQYLALSTTLDVGAGPDPGPGRDAGASEATYPPEASGPLPSFAGFRTIQRLGGGGMGEVYKLQDLKLDRFVAGKVVRAGRLSANLADFLREARSMALFKDRRIVQIFEFRADATPPVIVMEYVDGFELGRVGPSLEFSQRARILREICEALQHAHTLGLQHRDLKPSNIMLDGSLAPSSEGHAFLHCARTARPVTADRRAHGRLRPWRHPVRIALRNDAVRRARHDGRHSRDSGGAGSPPHRNRGARA
jgi:hypothetical protein